MSQELQHLIDRIQSEGVEEAEKKAGEILEAARLEAAKIVEEAQAEALQKVQKAEEDSALFESRSRETLRQSGRNLLIHIGDRLSAALDKIIQGDVDAALSGANLQAILIRVIPAFLEAKGTEDALSLLVSPEDVKVLEETFQSKFSEALKSGLRIEADESIAHGFMISSSGENAVHDFSAEAIAESLSVHLRSGLAEIIRESARLEGSA